MTRLPLTLRLVAYAAANLVLVFLLMPILAVFPASFNRGSFIRLPPAQYSTRWYQVFLNDPEWMTTLVTSLKVAVLATIIAVVVGTLAAIGLQSLRPRWRLLMTGLLLAPMIVPVIVTAVALYRTAIEFELSGTLGALALSHALLALPIVVINVGISLRALDPLWLRAAAGLGAGPGRIFFTIMLPNIVPGMIGAVVFAFLSSFDEVVVASFISGFQNKTLPVKMWEAIRLEFTPTVAVAAIFMISVAIVLFFAARLAGVGQTGEAK
jgi:putative spermidine/putrescine transport system permease protein